MKKCVIICGLNSNIPNLEDSFVIGVDKGALNLINNNISPDIAVGDFDSISEQEYQRVEQYSKKTIKLNPIKDDTDLEHALDLANEYDFKQIEIYGCLGGRLDHTLLNLKFVYQSNKNIILYDDRNRVFALESGNNLIKKDDYKYLSLFTFEESIISIKDCKYDLENTIINFNDNYTTSNEILNEECIITVSKGRVLVIQSNDVSML